MLGKTHKAIARFTAQKLNLKKRETELLEIGSIRPDSWANFPHHKDKEYEIAVSIFDARKHFLQNDDECFHDLGIALHYIADRWTLRPRISEEHTEWERQIDSAMKNDEIYSYPQLKEYVNTCTFPTKYTRRYRDLIEKCALGVEGMNDELGFGFVAKLVDKLEGLFPRWAKHSTHTQRLEMLNKFSRSGAKKGWGFKYSNWWGYWMEQSGIINIESERMHTRLSASEIVLRLKFGTYLKRCHTEFRKAGFKPLRGLGAKVVNFALLERRTSVWSTPALDLNFATWISLEVARNTLLQSGQGEWFDLERFPKSKDEE